MQDVGVNPGYDSFPHLAAMNFEGSDASVIGA